jgi:hypothetical protein
MKCLLEASVEFVLIDAIFDTPFDVFGERSKMLGSATLPTPVSEKWGHVTV